MTTKGTMPNKTSSSSSPSSPRSTTTVNMSTSTPMKPAPEEVVVSPCKTTGSTPPPAPLSTSHGASSLTTAEDWYLQGERVWYDPHDKQIVKSEDVSEERNSPSRHRRRFKIFQRVVLPEKTTSTSTSTSNTADQQENAGVTPSTPQQRWMTFLPSNPEGSYGFHLVEEALSCSSRKLKGRCDTESTEMSHAESITETNNEELQSDTNTNTNTNSASCVRNNLARLYLDYQGQGDSDTPPPLPTPSSASASSSTSQQQEPPSTTKQRADLVEALWEAHGIQRTVVVSAGDSSLVVMELLQRQRQRLAAGSPFPKILHVLALNGRYVAKTRHSSQLATITQLLRSERMGPSLAAKAQRSEFTLGQCLGPYLKGSSRQLRKQVAQIVRRNEGAAALVEMSRTVDDHLYEKHRYRWHLPHLLKAFCLDQGITFHLVTNTRSGQRQVQLVKQQLAEYQLAEDCPGVQYTHYNGGRAAGLATSSFLMDNSSPASQLEAFIKDVHKLAMEQIPMSDNSMPLSSYFGVRSSFDDDAHANADHSHADDDGEDSWHPNEEETSQHYDAEVDDDDEDQTPSLDTRLDLEIVFDASEVDDDDFDFF